MVRQELSRWLGMFFFRNFLIVNIGFLLAGLCLSLIFYRAYRERDGQFRRCLLWYFGTGACAIAMAVQSYGTRFSTSGCSLF